MKKRCTGCDTDFDEERFAFRSISRDIRRSICKDCSKAYARKHYQDNKSVYKANTLKRNDTHRLRDRKVVIDYLLHHPYVDCGERDLRCLDFDHVRPGKRRSVTVMSHHGYALSTLMREIELCEVRCANCHRKRTSIQLGFWSSTFIDTEHVSVAQ